MLKRLRTLSTLPLLALGSCVSQHTDQETPAPRVAQSPAPAKAEPAMVAKPTPASAKLAPAAGMLKSSYAHPTGDPETSALLLDKIVPAQVVAGQPFEYELRVTNLASIDLDNVAVSETLPENLSVIGTEPKVTSSASGQALWNLGSLAPGEQRSIKVRGSSKDTTAILSCATVAYTSGLCSTIPVVKPALALEQAGTKEALVCQDLELDYKVTNTGTGNARNVKVEVALPQGLTLAESGQSSVRSFESLGAGESRQFSLKVKAARTGEFRTTARASAEGGLAAQAIEVVSTVRQPVLKIAATGTPKLFAGRDIAYEINVQNVGDGVAHGARVEQRLDAATTFRKAGENGQFQGGKVTWSLGDLRPSESRKLTLAVNAAKIGKISSKLQAAAECAEDASTAVDSEVLGIPAILLEVVDTTDPIAVGDEVAYVITVTNQGSAPATNVKIGCKLPDNTQFVSADGKTQVTLSASNPLELMVHPLAALTPGQKASWKVTVKGLRPADARFAVELTSDQLTSPVSETEATTFYH
jgi:uncharacterized repeat protein (TIGR01451 family)